MGSPGESPPSAEHVRDYPVLYVDDEEPNLVVFEAAFSDEFEILSTSSPDEALEILARQPVAVMLADQRMAGMTGIELFEQVREKYPHVLRILVTAYSDQKTAIEAINRGGVLRYLAKPWTLEEVRLVLRDAVARAHLEGTVRTMRNAILDRERIATLAAMRARLLHDLANLDIVVAGASARLEFLLDPLKKTLDPELYSEVQDAVANLRMAVDHITDLHQKRSKASRLSPASPKYHRVREVVDTVKELVRNELGSRVTLTVECPADIVMWADRTDISRILMNLIRNARQALDAAGVQRGEIRVGVTREASSVTIEVSDNGPGVPPALASRVFEPAFTTKSAQGGSGLGLAICRELAHANNGEIELLERESTQNERTEGARFLVRMLSRPPKE